MLKAQRRSLAACGLGGDSGKLMCLYNTEANPSFRLNFLLKLFRKLFIAFGSNHGERVRFKAAHPHKIIAFRLYAQPQAAPDGLAALLLNRTALGRYTFALGSNEEAVRLSGVNVDSWKIAIYSLGGAICGVAGLLLASRINSAQPALGQGYELDAIAAVVIGGTSLSGGTGTVLGTIIGAFIMSVLTNGLRIMSVAQEWQTVVTGVIIILAVYADILRRKRS